MINHLQEFIPTLQQGRIAPLEIGGPLYELDTSNFSTIDYKKVSQAIENARNAAQVTDTKPTYE